MEPTATDTDSEIYEGDLTEDELKKLDELLQRLKDPAETLPAEYQERRIALRFLRGKKFVVDNAIATMRQHHKVKVNIGPINIQSAGEFLSQGIAQTPPTSRDKEGRKVVFLFGGRLPKHEGDFDRTRMFCYYAENELLTSVKTQRLGITLCGNARGMPLLANMAAGRNIVSTVSNSYPIRVGRILMMNPPWYFRLIFGALSVFMKQKMRDRVKLIKEEELSQYIDMENVPSDFVDGGKLDFDFPAYVLAQYKNAGVDVPDVVRNNLEHLKQIKKS